MIGQQLIAVDIGNSYAKLGWFPAAASAASESKELPLPTQTADFVTEQGPSNELLSHLPNEALRWPGSLKST